MLSAELTSFSIEMQQLIHSLLKNFERCEQMCLTQQGVTVAQAYTLLTFPQSNQITMNELSAKMGLAGSTMTRMIDQLVIKHLVQRKHDEQDRRIVSVELTAKGQQLQRTLDKAQREFFQGPLQQIGKDDRTRIVDALRKLNNLIVSGFGGCDTCNSD